MGLNEQITVFLAMAIYGVGVCVVFDMFRGICAAFKSSTLTVSIADILFWLILSIATFFAVFLANNGQIRFFEFLAMILSSIIYFLTLSRIVFFIFSKLFSWLKKFFFIFLKFFLTIVQFLYKMLLGILKCIFAPILRVFRRIWNFFKFIFAKTASKMRFGVRKRIKRRRIVRAEEGKQK